MPNLDRLRMTFAVAVVACLLLCGGVTSAQRQQSNTTDASQPNRDLFGDAPDRVDMRRLADQRERARNVERQKRMVDDANRLLVLAAQLHADLAKHGAMTPEDQQHLDEIERLARSVKDRMKG